MALRQSFGTEWALMIQRALIERVEAQYPNDLDRWPLLRGFEAEFRLINNGNYLMIWMRNRPGQITSYDAGTPQSFRIHPDLQGVFQKDNLKDWISYAMQVFQAKPADAIIFVPALDSKKFVLDDMTLWRQNVDPQNWNYQIDELVKRQFSTLP